MATLTPGDLRDAFAARLRDEELRNNFRLESLVRWIASVPDERVGEAIELVEIGLDATRPGREEVFNVIEYELRTAPHRNLPHWVCVAFLRWVVRGRPARAKVTSTLTELRAAKSLQKRDKLIARLDPDGGGRSAGSDPIPKSLANAHSIFEHAWRAAPPAARPTNEIHRGEVEPFIGARGTIRLAIFIARATQERAGVTLDKANAKAFEHLLSLAEDAAEKGGRPSEALLAALQETARSAKSSATSGGGLVAGVLSLARSACAEAKAVLNKPDAAGSATRPAAVKAVGLILESGGGLDAVRSFLSELDEELRRLDVVHALGTREKKPSRPIARAIFRGAEAKGKLVVWLAALEKRTAEASEPETYGLLAKEGRFWKWIEGGKEEILATVPDKYFERAALAAK